jgi:hypothetical protein
MGAGLAILGAVQAAGQIGYGIYQQRQAKKGLEALGQQPQQNFDYAKRAVAGQLNLAQGEAPGVTQQLQGVNQNLANTTQNIQNMAPSGAAGLGALVQANASGMQSYADILGQAAQTKLGLQQNYLSGVAGLQGYADQAFMTNQLNPYMDTKNRFTQLQGAGTENIAGGIQSGLSTIGSAIAANSVGDLTTQAVTLRGQNLPEAEVLKAIEGLSPDSATYKLYKTAYPQYVK